MGEPANPQAVAGRGLWNLWIWFAAGLAFWAFTATTSAGPRSPFGPLELGLHALMVAGLWAATRGRPISKALRLPRAVAPFAYIFLSWLFGMIFELTLTVNGQGVGGLHASTVPSFLLAQGDYIPIAIVSYLVIRRTHASFNETFFFAGGKSLTEGVILSGPLVAQIASPLFFLSPLTLAYYTLAYASFIAAPLVLVDPQLLWDTAAQPKRRPVLFYWALGLALAVVIRLFWGLVYGPAITQLFSLPASP